MLRYHLCSTSRALYRVFVAPVLLPVSSVSCILPTRNATLLPQLATLLPRTSVRTKVFTRKETQRHALSDSYTFDNAITTSRINFVDEKGRFFDDVALSDALTSYNRVTHHLVQMSPGKVDQFGVSDPENLPTCKVISKMDLRAQHQKKLEIERRTKQGIGTGPTPKTLELNWAIEGGDLKHRLEKLKGFLQEGRKVGVLLGPKRRGRQATGEECRSVLDSVREAVSECKGAGEVKKDGMLGGVMTLVFEGRVLEEKKAGEAVLKKTEKNDEKNAGEADVKKTEEKDKKKTKLVEVDGELLSKYELKRRKKMQRV